MSGGGAGSYARGGEAGAQGGEGGVAGMEGGRTKEGSKVSSDGIGREGTKEFGIEVDIFGRFVGKFGGVVIVP